MNEDTGGAAAVELRSALRADAAAMLAIYAPVVERTAISFELAPPGEAELAARVEAVQRSLPWLVCAEGEGVLGYAYAGPFRARPAYRWTVESTVYVHAGQRRRGVARALMTALLGLLELQGLRTVVAGIALPNEASAALHEALGFTHAGTFRSVGHKLGRWWDVGFWQRGLGELADTPDEPRPARDVIASRPGERVLTEAARLVRAVGVE